MDTSSRQKINKETLALNDTLEQRDLIDRTFHSKAAEYTFFSSAHGTFFQDRSHARPQKKVSVDLRKLKSYEASFPTTML